MTANTSANDVDKSNDSADANRNDKNAANPSASSSANTGPLFPASPTSPTRVMPVPYLSVERLKPYLASTNGHQKNALTLYRWNVAMSGAVYQALHYFEVVLRNAMDEQLSIWNATQTSALGKRLNREWAHEPAAALDRIAKKDIDLAYERAQKELDNKYGDGVRKPNHHDVIAQTSFGLWRYMLPSSSDTGKQVLWRQCLNKSFPHMIRPPDQLSQAVHGVYVLRNRVAHLEPLIAVNLEARYRNMITVTGDIGPDLQNWFSSVTQAVPNGLKARPTFE